MKKNTVSQLGNQIPISSFIVTVIEILLISVFILVSASCNSVKRVMGDPDKFNKVGKEWVKRNPLDIKHDTTYIAGVSRTVKVSVHDTITNKVPCSDFKQQTNQGSTIRVNNGKLTIDASKDSTYRVDTARFNFENLTRVYLLQKDNEACNLDNKRKDAEIDRLNGVVKNKDATIRNKKTQIILQWIGFALLVGAAIFLKVKKFFSWF